MDYAVGDVVKLKKAHPCGSSEWEILRTGADFRLKCMGCGTPDHDCAEAGGKKIPGAFVKRRTASDSPSAGSRSAGCARGWHKLTFRGDYGNIISHDTQKLGKALR